MPSRSTLHVSLTPELSRFVESRVRSGKYQSASEVVREALRLLEARAREPVPSVEALRDEIEDTENGKHRHRARILSLRNPAKSRPSPFWPPMARRRHEMSQRHRFDVAGECYHVMNRGIAKRTIAENAGDAEAFFEELSRVVADGILTVESELPNPHRFFGGRPDHSSLVGRTPPGSG